MEEDTTLPEGAALANQGLPPSGTGHQSGSAMEETDRMIATEHFNLALAAAPLQPISFAIPSTGQTATAQSGIELNNPYDLLAQHGSGAADRDIDRLGFGSIPGANTTTSGSIGNNGRDPIPLTPEILHLLDRVEPDKVKQARLLTYHLTGQRQLPLTEQALHQQLEKWAQKEYRKQQAAAKAAAKAAAQHAKAK